MTIHIIGHKNPDIDSIVCSLVFKDYLSKLGLNSVSCMFGKLNKETKFVLKYLDQKPPLSISSSKSKMFFLVDHADLGQSISNISSSQVLGIIDHHRISGIETDQPIFYRSEPLGSTSTLIFKMFEEKGIKLNKKQASLLLAGIISDTLNLSSSTTTKEDSQAVKKLKTISKIDIDFLAEKIFEAKSDVSGLSIRDLILRDYKDFEFGKKNIGIGVFETTSLVVLEKLSTQSILKEMLKIKQQKKLDFIFWALVDIYKKKSFLYLASQDEKELARKAFNKKTIEQIMILDGVVSRKKQIVPPISKALN